MTRIKIIIDEQQQDLAEQIKRLQLKVVGISEKSDRAFGLKADLEEKTKEVDKVVDQKLQAA